MPPRLPVGRRDDLPVTPYTNQIARLSALAIVMILALIIAGAMSVPTP